MAVDNYLYKFADGSTGNTPWKGGSMLDGNGAFAENGIFMGRTMADGSVNQSPIGNVNANGMVDTYGGYQTPAAVYNQPQAAPTGGAVFGGSAVPARPAAAPAAPTGGAVFGGSAVPARPAAAPAAAPAPAYKSVADLYSGLLGRAGDTAGMDYWTAQFGAEIDSNEQAAFLAAARPEMSNNVGNLYQQHFGRDADSAGQQWWQGQVGQGQYNSMADLSAAVTAGAAGEDKSAIADGAQYGRAWNSGLNANSTNLVYNAAQDRWEEKTGGAAAAAGGGNNYNADLNRQVDAKTMTIEGRINNIMARDVNGNYTNPVIQQAAMRARQSFAGRGLLNSSMSEQAALEAVTAKAIEIAGPDAQTYFSQGRANQDATNVFARDEQNYKYDLNKMDVANGYDLNKMGVANGYELEKMGAANGYDLNKMGVANGYDMAKTDKVQGYENLRQDKQIAEERLRLAQSGSQFSKEMEYKYASLNLGESSRKEAEIRAQANAVEINNIGSVNTAYDLYLRRISEIDNNTNFSDKTKIEMKNSAGMDFDIMAKAKGIVWQQMGGRFSAAPDPAPAPAPAPGQGRRQSGGAAAQSGQSESGG